MFTIGDMTALPDAARVLKGFFRFHGHEPERPIGHWAIKRLILDGEIASRRIGIRIFIPKTELMAAARHFGYRPPAAPPPARPATLHAP